MEMTATVYTRMVQINGQVESKLSFLVYQYILEPLLQHSLEVCNGTRKQQFEKSLEVELA